MEKKAIMVLFQEITQTAYLVHIEYMLSIELLIFIYIHFLQGYKALKQHQKVVIIRHLYQFSHRHFFLQIITFFVLLHQ